jgi:uncharacterized membrane protein
MRDYGAGQGLVRSYAQIAGVVVLLVGVLGLVLGDQSIGGLLNVDLPEDIIHLVTGGALAYAGFAIRDNATVRTVVGALGVLYIAVGILGFLSPTLFGVLPSGYTIFDNVFHLGLGVISVIVAWYIGREREATPAG